MRALKRGRGTLVVALALLGAGCLTDFAGLPDSQQGGTTQPPPAPPPPPPPPPPKVTTIVIKRSGPDTLAALGATNSFSAEARDANGNLMSGVAFTWSVDNSAIASLNSNNNEVTATAADNGVATIRASAEGVSGSSPIVVWQRVVDVDLAPPSPRLGMFESVDLEATAFDSNDRAVTRPLTYSWQADRDPAVTIMPHSGNQAKVTRVFTGRTIVTGTAEGVSGNAVIRDDD